MPGSKCCFAVEEPPHIYAFCDFLTYFFQFLTKITKKPVSGYALVTVSVI